MALSRINLPAFTGIDQSGEGTAASTSPRAQNFDTRTGALKRCGGYARYIAADAPGDITTLLKFSKRSGAAYEQSLLAATATGVYSWNGTSWDTVTSGRTSGAYSFINYQLDGADVMFMSNGCDDPLKWDGQAAAAVTSIPDFSHLTLHYERMWGAGVAGEPDRVYYSVAFDPEDFTTAEKSGFIDIPTFDGGSVISIVGLLNDVVVFKSENIYRIYGTYPDTYEVSPVYGIVGPIAARSIASTGTAALFLSREGLCAYDGVKAAPFATAKISGVTGRINPAYAAQATGVFHDGVYYLALPLDDSTVNNAVLEYDTRTGGFMLHTGLCVTSFLTFDGKLLMADGGGTVYEWGAGGKYGTGSIDAVWETPELGTSDPDTVKHVRRVYLTGRGNVRVSVKSEAGVRSREIDLGSERTCRRANLFGRGRRLALVFENVGGGELELSPPTLIVETEGD